MNQEYPAVGLRYFNVYGRGEENKGKMASMAYKMNQEYLESKKISLLKEPMVTRTVSKKEILFISMTLSL